ncbi:MAG: hypothetical protein QNJ55_21410 [Xenococcus sp. MO_188.B8]|nr:hypothetical protein [Xenococcus sp. MO_188.B8]
MTTTPNNSLTSLSFPEAIAFTQSLMEKITEGKLQETEIQEQVTSLVSSQNGARGFFVTYLTSDSALADNPSPGIIRALQTSLLVEASAGNRKLAIYRK